MVADQQALPVATQQVAAVDAQQIEHDLGQLWRELAAEPGTQVNRVCMFNLVVVAPASAADRTLEMVLAVAGIHPCRALLLAVDESASAPALEASVTAACRLPTAGGTQVCGEVIRLLAHGSAAMRSIGVVTPLLLPDLPTYLWWALPGPAQNALFERLSPLAERIIVDTRQGGEAAVALLAATVSHYRTTDWSDLAWTTLTPWRELVAELFDPPEQLAMLPAIDRLTVTSAGSPAAALLFAGWLATQLDWQPADSAIGQDDDAAWQWRLRGPAGDIAVLGRTTSPQFSVVDGALLGADIHAHTAERSMRCRIVRTAETTVRVRTVVSGEPVQERVMQLEPERPETAIVQEVQQPVGDRILLAALATVAAVASRAG